VRLQFINQDTGFKDISGPEARRRSGHHRRTVIECKSEHFGGIRNVFPGLQALLFQQAGNGLLSCSDYFREGRLGNLIEYYYNM